MLAELGTVEIEASRCILLGKGDRIDGYVVLR